MADLYRIALLAAPIVASCLLLWKERKPSQERSDARFARAHRVLR